MKISGMVVIYIFRNKKKRKQNNKRPRDVCTARRENVEDEINSEDREEGEMRQETLESQKPSPVTMLTTQALVN